MKVQIKQLEPNPYRDMNNYPMDEAKVKSLIGSIQQTGFWDNILARKKDGMIQIFRVEILIKESEVDGVQSEH